MGEKHKAPIVEEEQLRNAQNLAFDRAEKKQKDGCKAKQLEIRNAKRAEARRQTYSPEARRALYDGCKAKQLEIRNAKRAEARRQTYTPEARRALYDECKAKQLEIRNAKRAEARRQTYIPEARRALYIRTKLKAQREKMLSKPIIAPAKPKIIEPTKQRNDTNLF